MTRPLRALRPTGNPISFCGLVDSDSTTAATIANGLNAADYSTYWVNSGTAALALAIQAAKYLARCDNPEVILPAYGCPDLIAAALYAGARPVLVDIQINSAAYDFEQLQQAITPNTAAIVSATLLGIRGHEATLRAIIDSRPIALIEDSAQWLPRTPQQHFFGDFVVLSFGRGKPVNLLAGGALLARKPLPTILQQHTGVDRGHLARSLRHLLKIATYNAVIHPTLYGLLERLPFLGIGATEFHPLKQIEPIPSLAHTLLAANARDFCQRDTHIQQLWAASLSELADGGIVDLAASNNVPPDSFLLRYPIHITDPKRRDAIYVELRRHGLGASIMYPAPLADIPGVPVSACAISGYANARIFASRLLTLPTHKAVDAATVAKTRAILQQTA